MQDRKAPAGEQRGRAPRPVVRAVLALAAIGLLVGLLSSPERATAQAVPPDADYRTFETEHFRVTYPPDLESLAPAAAADAERAYEILAESFLPPPSSTIDLVLTDHTDSPNGTASIFPSPRLVIWAQPPVEGLALSHFDEWLELVILHELVHIFQLDHAGTPGRIVRTIFGRVPWTWPAFPGYAIGPLGIEGVAVHRESLHTRAGRVHGGMHDAIVRTDALDGSLETVGQALGRSPVWPGGDRPYVFGGEFFRHLSDRYGEEAVVDFLDALADQWIPYRLNAAAERAFGQSFEDLWGEWSTAIERDAAALANPSVESAEDAVGAASRSDPELLTEGARYGLHPAAGPDELGIAFVRSDGRSETALVRLAAAGEEKLARWNGLDPPRWFPDGSLLVPQAEYLDNYRVHRDLYRVTLDGEVTRLTSGLRVLHADPHPSGGPIAAVLSADGTTQLALITAEGRTVRVLREVDLDAVWSYPTWAPEGERLAVARRRPDGRSAIVVLNARGDLLHELSEDRSMNTAPAWSPDGRALIWSSDRSGIPNLYGVRWPSATSPPTPPQQITDVATAVTFPSVDPGGEWIYASVLTEDGWEVGRWPHDPVRWVPAGPPDPTYVVETLRPETGSRGPDDLRPGLMDPDEVASAADPPTAEPSVGDGADRGTGARAYSAIPTLLPRYWEPLRIERGRVLGRRVLPVAWGARTSGVDLVGRHEYQASYATPLESVGRQSEWSGRYRWLGLGNPAFVLEAAQDWGTRSPIVVEGAGEPRGADDPDVLAPVLRERWFGGSVELRRRRARHSAAVSLGARSIDLQRKVFELDGQESERYQLLLPSTSLTEARIAVGLSTARSYAFSVSLEDGVSLTAGLRQRWDRMVPDSLAGRPGLDGAVREAVVAARAYHGFRGPGYANHVLAARVAAGVADGPASRTGHFALGGREGQFPVRGLAEGARRGRSAWAASLEWRFPLVLIHQGVGAWPLYFDRIAGSLFFDAAGAEHGLDSGGTDWDTRTSVGVELTATLAVFFEGLDRLRLGLAVPLGPAGDRTGRAAFYLATGWSF